MCAASVIATFEKEVAENGYDSNCLDMEYQRETGNVSVRLLNSKPRVMYLEDKI